MVLTRNSFSESTTDPVSATPGGDRTIVTSILPDGPTREIFRVSVAGVFGNGRIAGIHVQFSPEAPQRRCPPPDRRGQHNRGSSGQLAVDPQQLHIPPVNVNGVDAINRQAVLTVPGTKTPGERSARARRAGSEAGLNSQPLAPAPAAINHLAIERVNELEALR